MRSGRTLLVLAAAALVPLLAPAAWLRAGAFPDVALLVVVYVALEAGPAPAAWCGAGLGLLGCPWTAEPLCLQAFLLGTAGFLAGAIRQALFRDEALVQLALVASLTLAVRLVSALLAGGPGDALATVPAALLAALATALAAPPVFGLLGALRLFRRRRLGGARV